MQNSDQTNEYIGEGKSFELKRYNPEKCIERYSYMLIRPPRFYYCEEILNPSIRFKNKFQHFVFQIPFKLSLYCPPHIKYIVLYLHGNSSSRYEGYSQLHLLPPDVGLACFDFNGCGNRNQKGFISLGKFQSKEVDIAVKFLKQKGLKVAIWGRSMGAVSGLLSKQADIIIADSAFSSLYQTCRELSKTQVCMPCYCCFQCIFPCFFWIVSNDVEQKSGMNYKQLQIRQYLASTSPNKHILFLAAADDSMISYKHSQILFNSFPGVNKKIIVFEGTHNSDRPRTVLSEMFSFIEDSLFKAGFLNRESNIGSKVAEFDSVECVRNDLNPSIQLQSEFGVRGTVQNLLQSEQFQKH